MSIRYLKHVLEDQDYYINNCYDYESLLKVNKDIESAKREIAELEKLIYNQIQQAVKVVKYREIIIRRHQQYRDIIIPILDLEGVEIELCGSWIWVSGNTKEHKDLFKELGFYWAPKKFMWYWRPEEFKSYSRKSKSMSDIRNKYGSEKIIDNTKRVK